MWMLVISTSNKQSNTSKWYDASLIAPGPNLAPVLKEAVESYGTPKRTQSGSSGESSAITEDFEKKIMISL
jgi:hypothetical protein